MCFTLNTLKLSLDVIWAVDARVLAWFWVFPAQVMWMWIVVSWNVCVQECFWGADLKLNSFPGCVNVSFAHGILRIWSKFTPPPEVYAARIHPRPDRQTVSRLFADLMWYQSYCSLVSSSLLSYQ